MTLAQTITRAREDHEELLKKLEAHEELLNIAEELAPLFQGTHAATVAINYWSNYVQGVRITCFIGKGESLKAAHALLEKCAELGYEAKPTEKDTNVSYVFVTPQHQTLEVLCQVGEGSNCRRVVTRYEQYPVHTVICGESQAEDVEQPD